MPATLEAFTQVENVFPVRTTTKTTFHIDPNMFTSADIHNFLQNGFDIFGSNSTSISNLVVL